MAGQVGKIENPETLPKQRFQGATFENIIPIFLEFTVFEKFAKNENIAFCLSKYTKNIWKIDKVLSICVDTIYKTRTRCKLSIRALLFVYLTIGSFKFFKHFGKIPSTVEELPFQAPMKTAKIAQFYGLKTHLGMSDMELKQVLCKRVSFLL